MLIVGYRLLRNTCCKATQRCRRMHHTLSTLLKRFQDGGRWAMSTFILRLKD